MSFIQILRANADSCMEETDVVARRNKSREEEDATNQISTTLQSYSPTTLSTLTYLFVHWLRVNVTRIAMFNQ